MNTTRVVTFWDAGQAYEVIQFLDLLRDQLWESYGDQITTDQCESYEQEHDRRLQYSLDLDEQDPF